MLVKIYPENPNPREVGRVVQALLDGALIVYPTDTVYAIGCDALNVRAVERICKLKGVNPQKSNLSIVCHDLSGVSEYARVSNAAFKLMKRNLPARSPLFCLRAAACPNFTGIGRKWGSACLIMPFRGRLSGNSALRCSLCPYTMGARRWNTPPIRNLFTKSTLPWWTWSWTAVTAERNPPRWSAAWTTCLK